MSILKTQCLFLLQVWLADKGLTQPRRHIGRCRTLLRCRHATCCVPHREITMMAQLTKYLVNGCSVDNHSNLDALARNKRIRSVLTCTRVCDFSDLWKEIHATRSDKSHIVDKINRLVKKNIILLQYQVLYMLIKRWQVEWRNYRK